MVAILAILLFFAVSIPLSFYNGVVVADAWNWFVKDSFGVAALSSLQGWGLMLFLGSTKILKAVQEALKAEEKVIEKWEILQKSIKLNMTYFLTLLFTHGYIWFIHTLFW